MSGSTRPFLFLIHIMLFWDPTAQAERLKPCALEHILSAKPVIPPKRTINESELARLLRRFQDTKHHAIEKFIKAHRHIGYQEFETAVKHSVDKAIASIGKDPFVVMLPSNHRSNYWVGTMAYRYLTKERGIDLQRAGIYLGYMNDAASSAEKTMHSVETEYDASIISRAGIRNIVLVDDAIFSGEQLQSHAELILNNFPPHSVKLHIITPFISSRIDPMQPFLKSASLTAQVYFHDRIVDTLNILKDFSDEEREVIGSIIGDDIDWSYPVYFDHKTPDNVPSHNSIPLIQAVGFSIIPPFELPYPPDRL